MFFVPKSHIPSEFIIKQGSDIIATGSTLDTIKCHSWWAKNEERLTGKTEWLDDIEYTDTCLLAVRGMEKYDYEIPIVETQEYLMYKKLKDVTNAQTIIVDRLFLNRNNKTGWIFYSLVEL